MYEKIEEIGQLTKKITNTMKTNKFLLYKSQDPD